MGYSTIGTQIASILQSNITTAKVVYNYSEPLPSGYPAITVEAHDGNGVFADTSRNRREYIFRIVVMQERIKTRPADAERLMRTLVDQVISTFDSRTNLNLNNTCDFAYPIPSTWGYIQGTDVDVRSAEVLLVAVTLQ